MKKSKTLDDRYQHYQQYKVTDVKSLKEFIERYHIVKPTICSITEEIIYFGYSFSTYEDIFNKQGFYIISSDFSVTGKTVAFYK